jgi:hypothetical protein
MTTIWKRARSEDSGQALVELALSVSLLLVLGLGVIDVARAIYYVEVIKNLTGEGSSMASRSTPLTLTAQTVVTDAGTDLNIGSKGCVIITSVTNTGATKNPLQVTGQASQGSCTGITSKIGCYPPPATCGVAALSSEANAALQVNQSLFITEIFYTYSTVTPIGTLLNKSSILPTQLYDAAYY